MHAITTPSQYDAPALRQGLAIIEALAASTLPLGLSDIARLVGANKNMTTRALSVLVQHGWIMQEWPGPRYRLTLRPFTIVSKPVAHLTLHEVARQPLTALWEECGESVYLAQVHDAQVLYLEHFDGSGPVRIAGRVGGQYPLHCTAPGKVLLAFHDQALVEQIIVEGLTAMTEATLTDPAALRDALQTIRAQGYALDVEEYGRGLLCLAAPIFSADALAGAVGISVTTLAYTPDRLVEMHAPRIIATAETISHRMGAPMKREGAMCDEESTG